MWRSGTRENSFIVATLLAVLTVGVFFVLQNYGPESAVRRFHLAVANKDAGELARATQQDIRSIAVQALIGRVRSLQQAARSVTLYSGQRRTRQVLVVAEYRAANGYKFPMPWLVEKVGSTNWKVDAEETLSLMDRYRLF